MEQSKRNLQNYFFYLFDYLLIMVLLLRTDLGMRFKYHYYNGAKQRNFLGLFLKTFGWENFAVTVIEVCPKDKLGVHPSCRRNGRQQRKLLSI